MFNNGGRTTSDALIKAGINEFGNQNGKNGGNNEGADS